MLAENNKPFAKLFLLQKMNNHEGVEHILKLLRGATDDQFESFICALEETNQEYAASLLRQEGTVQFFLFFFI